MPILKVFQEGPLPKQKRKREAFFQKTGVDQKSSNIRGKRHLFGKVAATFKGPFGEPIRITGTMGKANPFRFSTHYTDDETDLVYAKNRYYNPSTGRFLSRDPIEEQGGPNLYGFVGNDPIDGIDPFGLDGLKFSSEGKSYVNGRIFGYNRTHDESGKRSDTTAWYWNQVFVKNCPGGICNSGGENDSSSFVVAEVQNTSKCPLNVDCTCTVSYAGSTWSAFPLGGFVAKGHVLGVNFSQKHVRDNISDGRTTGDYVSAGANSFTQQKSFTLSAGASMQLYRAITVVSFSAKHGDGFYESMRGECSCSTSSSASGNPSKAALK